jgi:hypothetical protein
MLVVDALGREEAFDMVVSIDLFTGLEVEIEG